MNTHTALNSGARVGSEFLWIDIDRIKIKDGDRLVVITARDRYVGGEIIRREIATYDHVHSLRKIATELEKAIAEAKGEDLPK